MTFFIETYSNNYVFYMNIYSKNDASKNDASKNDACKNDASKNNARKLPRDDLSVLQMVNW